MGEYTQSSEWYGEQSGGGHSITGILHTDVTIAVKDSSLHLKVVVGSEPWQLLAFETVADVVSDSLLGYAFTDNWGAKGRGQFFRLDDGSFQLNNDVVDDPNMTAVGMLYGRHNVLQVIPDFENTYNTKAEAYYKQQQYNKAIRLTEVLLQGHPKNTRALLYIKQASLTKSEEVKYELFKKYISDLKNLYKNQGYATLFLQLKNALKDEIYI